MNNRFFLLFGGFNIIFSLFCFLGLFYTKNNPLLVFVLFLYIAASIYSGVRLLKIFYKGGKLDIFLIVCSFPIPVSGVFILYHYIKNLNNKKINIEDDFDRVNSVEAVIYKDYQLDSQVYFFESYVFSTTQRHINKHEKFDGEIVLVDGNREVERISCVELVDRKASLTKFNSLLKRQIGEISPDKISVCLCDFNFLDERDMDDLEAANQNLIEKYIEWCRENNRVGCLVQHLHQSGRVPHCHMIYQKGNIDSEFQRYFMGELNE